jgi:WD40 repeat protein
MKIVSYLNVSNPNNLLADSGFVLQRLLLETLADFGHEIVLLAPIEAQEHTAMKVIPIEAPLTKYHARFDFNWKSIAIITQGLWNDVDILIVNQIELAAPLKALTFSESHRNIPIISYVHYLPINGINHERELIYDSSLNDAGLGAWILGTIKTAIECADACVVESKFAKELLMTQIGIPKKLEIIHPPVETELQLSSQQSFSYEKVKIIYNHRLYAHYGTAELFDWIDVALKGYENKCEILVTSPRGKRTQNQRDLDVNSETVANEVCSRPYVKIVEARSRSEYHKILASVHLGVAPLRPAPLWNLSIVDLLATGKPVLASRSGAFPELLEDSPEYLFSDRDEFIMKLRQLIESPPIPSPTLAERICDKFHPKNIASQWERLLVKTLNEALVTSDKQSGKNSKKMSLKPLITLGNQLLQHNDLITSLKWSPCGKYLASCSHDGLLRLWDSKDFNLIKEYSTNHERIQSLEWTPDGLGIIFVDDDGCIYRLSTISNHIEWITKVTPYALTSLCLDENTVYCADRSGHIHKCDSKTGFHIPSHNQVNQVIPKVYSSIDERYVMRLEQHEYSIADVDNLRSCTILNSRGCAKTQNVKKRA